MLCSSAAPGSRPVTCTPATCAVSGRCTSGRWPSHRRTCTALSLRSGRDKRPLVRIALGFYGLARNLELTLPSIVAHVMRPLAAASAGALDVFVHAILVGVEGGAALRKTDFLRLSPCAFAAEQQAIIDAEGGLANLARASMRWRIHHGLPWYGGYGQGPNGQATLINSYRKLYSLSKLADLIITRQRAARQVYTHVVAARPDVAYYTPMRGLQLQLSTLANLSSRGVAIPNVQHFGGLNDRFAIGDAEAMLHKAMRPFDSLAAAHRKRPWDEGALLRTNSTEGFLCNYMVGARVRVSLVPLCMVRVRSGGRRVGRDAFSTPERARECEAIGLIRGIEDMRDACQSTRERFERGDEAVRVQRT
jgi:hypothetical protein